MIDIDDLIVFFMACTELTKGICFCMDGRILIVSFLDCIQENAWKGKEASKEQKF
jgi:hypothetical protein